MVDLINVNNNTGNNILKTNNVNVRREYGYNSGLEVTPKKDSFEKKESSTQNTVVAVGLGALALGALFGVKSLMKASYLKNAQKTFEQVFMRKDITLDETKEILKRYKEIEKISNKEDYIKALFEEAKKNYGLEHLASQVEVAELPALKDGMMLGTTDPLGNITVNSKIENRGSLLNTVHHELRHLKQRYYAFNIAPDDYVAASQPKNMSLPKEIFEAVFGGKADKSKIPLEDMQFAEKASKGIVAYNPVQQGSNQYLAQWVETDAFDAGNNMQKILCNTK